MFLLTYLLTNLLTLLRPCLGWPYCPRAFGDSARRGENPAEAFRGHPEDRARDRESLSLAEDGRNRQSQGINSRAVFFRVFFVDTIHV